MTKIKPMEKKYGLKLDFKECTATLTFKFDLKIATHPLSKSFVYVKYDVCAR